MDSAQNHKSERQITHNGRNFNKSLKRAVLAPWEKQIRRLVISTSYVKFDFPASKQIPAHFGCQLK